MPNYIVTYSQNREDVILAGFFKEGEKGLYVDIGANHPLNGSVTKLFYERGWRGLNIEPSRKMFTLLKEDRPKDINLNIGIAEKAGTLTLREYADVGYSTMSETMMKEHEAQPQSTTERYVEYKVPVKPLKTVFAEQKVRSIQFMKIDIEGYEYHALASNDWEKYRPEVICIEANHVEEDWRPLLAKHQYRLVFFDGLNEYYVAKEAEHRAEEFSYAEKLLLGKPILPAQWKEVIDDRDQKIVEIQGALNAVAHQAHEQQEHINKIEAENAYLKRSLWSRLDLVRRGLRAAKKTDRSILQSAHRPPKKKLTKTKQTINQEQQTSAALLNSVKRVDVDTFYRQTRKRQKSLKQGVVLYVYKPPRDVAIKSLRAVLHKVRKVKGGAS